MTAAPLVSVCIPTFNHAQFLPDALESARSQTYPNIEILVADNNSTDATAAIIADAMRQDARIRQVRHATNLGMARNFSSCVETARGEYLKFLCDDDRLAPDCVSRLAAMMVRHPQVALAGCARQFSDEHWQPLHVLGAGPDREETVPGAAMRVTCLARGNVIGEPTAVMFRRLDAMRGFSVDYSQLPDLEMWLHLLTRGAFAYTPAVLCTVRLHRAQETQINLRAGRVIADKRRLFREFAPELGPSLSIAQRLLWDARFALSAERTRRAGGATPADEADGAVFYPRLYRSIVNPLVTAALRMRWRRNAFDQERV